MIHTILGATGATAAVLLGLADPAGAAAPPAVRAITGAAQATHTGSAYPFYVRGRTCARSGGAHGYGALTIQVEQDELGVSRTNYFVQLAQLQYFAGGRWHADSRIAKARSAQFANDARSFTYTRTWKASFGPNEAGRPARLVLKLSWKSNAGTLAYLGDDVTVAMAVASPTCS